MRNSRNRICQLCFLVPLIAIVFSALLFLSSLAQQAAESQVQSSTPNPNSTEPTKGPILPLQAQRPTVRVNLRPWSEQLSEQLLAVSNKTNCGPSIARYYEQNADSERLEIGQLRADIVAQMSQLLGQHRAAVDSIVRDAERLAANHQFVKNLRVNYTDVHRLRNKAEFEAFQAQFVAQQQEQQRQQQEFIQQQRSLDQQIKDTSASDALNQNLQQQMLDTWGISGGSQQANEKTTINGGAPVPGPPEWQTPIQTIVMQMNKNFGDIPVNLSMSAVHLPLPVYPGLPEIMNTIAWTEGLDGVFKRNLANFMHVHHQYYGDSAGVLRTFPAHKWRIPRLEPDLFDARMRLWYLAGVSAAKDIVILVDSSGSMTGLRREIAKGIVFELLDTLRNDDYFAVLRFSETITPVGFPRCANLKQPRSSALLRDICPQFLEQHHMLIMQQQQAQPLLPRSYQVSSQQVDYRELLSECQAYKRQLELQAQYPRDHPDFVPGKNNSYMLDSAYFKSLKNVTEDIRDSYLLPATSRNIRYLKSNFSMPTAGIANFTHALMGAFELLHSYNRTTDQGAQCNKAIVLITDGAIHAHEEIFNRLNYPNASVRLFTYMVGREVGDIKPTKAMACSNRGYYANVINLSEIREQVQKYLPVMLRPAILSNFNHATTWTNAYGDETYQVLTDWVLEVKRRERARLMLVEERERMQTDANSSDIMITIELTNIPEYDELPLVDEELKYRAICEDLPSNGSATSEEISANEQSLHDEMDPLGYNELGCHWNSRRAELLASVVKPVYSLRNTSLVFQRIQHKNIWIDQPTQMRNAKLLGVAAVDLRLADLMKLAPSFQLGVNSYAFLVGHHGFVLHHPNLRALLEDPFDKQSKILKPYFNAVDLIHIEQAHLPNEFVGSQNKRPAEEAKLMRLRENILRHRIGNESIQLKRAIDCRRRLSIREQTFYYAPIKDTPYSLAIALPQSYGLNRLRAVKDLDENSARYLARLARNEATGELSPNATEHWFLHPEYRYCDGAKVPNSNTQQQQPDQARAIEALLHKLGSLRNQNWEEIAYADLNSKVETYEDKKLLSKRLTCDLDLFPSLLFDAAATQDYACNLESLERKCQNSPQSSWWGSQRSEQPWCSRNVDDMRHRLAQIYGLEMSFIATRSGLTRLRLFDTSARIRKLAEVFAKKHDKAVEEPWYSRAVEWNMRASEENVIITVPYNAYIRLIAKLRQRITQRHPMAGNDSRSNCDPSWDSEETGGDELTSPSSDITTASPSLSSPSQPLSSSTTAKMIDEFPQNLNDLTTTQTGAPDQAQTQAQSDAPQADEPNSDDEDDEGSSTGSSTTEPPANRINYNDYSSFDFLDLIANSSVHVSAMQSVIAHRGDRRRRTPVAVGGLLYDYASFARRFLNSTSINIEQLPEDQADIEAATMDSLQQPNVTPQKIDLCPGGECATKCGFRNDTIDCLLVDNNGFIIVAEDLPNVGRSLVDYDERLLASLVERGAYRAVQLIDYQAICARNENQVQPDQTIRSASLAAQQSSSSGSMTGGSLATSAAGLFSFSLVGSLLRNLMSSVLFVAGSLYSNILLQSSPSLSNGHWWYSASEQDQLMHYERLALVGAQSVSMNQSMQLSLLPNKTYLRPCEKTQTLYEFGPQDVPKLSIQRPEYYVTRCGCSGWYVYQSIPKTNLLMLIVNTTSACRRCPSDSFYSPNHLGPIEGVPMSPLVNEQQPNSESSPSMASTPLQQLQVQQSQQQQLANRTAEEQVCFMLERDSQLYIRRQEFCISQHPDEAEIKICGRAQSALSPPSTLLLLALSSTLIALHFLPLGLNQSPRAQVKKGYAFN